MAQTVAIKMKISSNKDEKSQKIVKNMIGHEQVVLVFCVLRNLRSQLCAGALLSKLLAQTFK